MGIRKITSYRYWPAFRNVFLVVLGCLILAFGDAVFFTPFEIVSGGAVSIGIIVAHFFNDSVLVNDIVVAAFQVAFFLIGLFVLGKKFSAHTLLATIAYPLFYTLFLRTGAGSAITEALMEYKEPDGTIAMTSVLLAGIFGGAIGGLGCALTFLGHGSTGGFDILVFIISKYTSIKEGVSSFCIDALTIIAGVCVLQDWVGAMIGIISAFVAALFVQYFYVYSQSTLIVDIISEKTDEIMDYIHVNMDHGTTLIDTVGGYTGEDRTMLRVIIYRHEMNDLSDYIASVDPKAFVSFTVAKFINGEGFTPFRHYSRKNEEPSLVEEAPQNENKKEEKKED